MSKSITNNGHWKSGQSGNPKGRPRKDRVLTELLRARGETPLMVGSENVTAQEALARAVWQFAVTGEVWLAGKRLKATSVGEWANVVKWLYSHVEPTSRVVEPNEDNEFVIRVVREE
jgi:hypothetical protein